MTFRFSKRSADTADRFLGFFLGFFLGLSSEPAAASEPVLRLASLWR